MSVETQERQVLRYRIEQRWVYALLATSFIVLLFTGLALLSGWLSPLAAGGTSRMIHRVAAVGYMAVPFFYLIVDRKGALELLRESFTYDRDDWGWLKHMGRYALGRASGMPPQGRLNAGQKLHHAGIIIVSVTIVASGLVLWALKSSLGETGLAWAAGIHDLSMLALTLLLVGHLYFTYVYNAISGMTTGYVGELEARLEHPKWVEELEEKEELEEQTT